jgi:hypothetical protein
MSLYSKHKKTDRWFRLPKWPLPVKTYNAETTKKHKCDVSWSHGITHFEDRLGNTGWCGVAYFEENAIDLGKTLGNTKD